MVKEEVIQAVLNQIHGKTYVEIGVASGGCFWSVKAKRKVGTDPGLRIKLQKRIRGKVAEILSFRYERLYPWTSDQFFAAKPTNSYFLKHKIDVAFVDGLHTYEQSLKDILNCLKHLSRGGVVIVHDCSPASQDIGISAPPENVRGGADDFHSKWSGEVWKTIVHLRSFRSDLHVFVLDCDHGVGVITLGKPENMLDYSPKAVEEMTYGDLAQNREKLLNLKNQNYLYEFLKSVNGDDRRGGEQVNTGEKN